LISILKMRFPALLASIATLFQASQAFQSIIVGESYNITAGTDVPVTIINDDNDAKSVNYTVGLYTSAGNSLICIYPTPRHQTTKLTLFKGTLVDSLPILTTKFTVSIPASVGPSGFYYALWIISFTSGGGINAPFPSYSESFYLSSGNGTLTSYEVLGPVPNQVTAQGFYSGLGSAPPCSSYDCWRQCAKRDPPVFEDNGQGLAQAGQTFYDERYIECLEACPNVKKPLPTEVNGVATTTTGIGPLPTSNPNITDVVPGSGCDVRGGETFCGRACCKVGVKCFYWNQCSSETVDLKSSPSAATSTASATESGSGTKPTDGSSKNSAGQLRIPFLVSGLAAFVRLPFYI
jgi:hypothetical protein